MRTWATPPKAPERVTDRPGTSDRMSAAKTAPRCSMVRLSITRAPGVSATMEGMRVAVTTISGRESSCASWAKAGPAKTAAMAAVESRMERFMSENPVRAPRMRARGLM